MDHRVAKIERALGCAVSRGHPQVAARVHDRPRRIPDPAHAARGNLVVGQGAGPVRRGRHDRTLVLTAITIQPAKGDINPPASQRDRPTLLFHQRRQSRRVDRTVPAHGPRCQIQREELVMRPTLQKGDHEHRSGRDVHHGSPGDP